MADFKLKLESSAPSTLSHRAIVLVGSSGDYKLYAGNSSNNAVQVTPTLPMKQVESVSIDDTDDPYAVSTNARKTVVLVDASTAGVSAVLPPLANWANQFIVVKKIDSSSNNVIIEPEGAETIEGNGSITLSTQWGYRILFSDGNQIVEVGS